MDSMSDEELARLYRMQGTLLSSIIGMNIDPKLIR